MKQTSCHNVLGLGYVVAHDSNSALVAEDGEIVFACSEERFSRKKRDGSAPLRTIAHAKSLTLDTVPMVCSYYDPTHYGRIHNTEKDLKARLGMKVNKRHTEILQELGASAFLGHHFSHAAGAYYTSGYTDALVVTYDAGILCEPWLSTIWIGTQGELKLLHQRAFEDNAKIALWYSAVTAFLGFKPSRDEGKITGLAAHGVIREECIDALTTVLSDFDQDQFFSIFRDPLKAQNYSWLKARFSDADMAAAIQYMAEEHIVEFLKQVTTNREQTNCVLAGGLFTNVRVNQKIKQLGFKNMYVYPAMGDEGLGVGAALGYLAQTKPILRQLDHVYLGPSYTNGEIESALVQAHLRHDYYANIESVVAQLLAHGHIVARFNGAMEFGPRALGNRSILYQTTDPQVNNWLNQKLERTEFMPFAPVTLAEHASYLYKDLEGTEQCTKFMTICVDCTDHMKQLSPAVVHIDGTARPQLVTQQTNASLYRILTDYYQLTGIPSLVNTSFNMHGEPIVCSPEDAIRCFLLGQLDYLAIGDFLVAHPGTRVTV